MVLLRSNMFLLREFVTTWYTGVVLSYPFANEPRDGDIVAVPREFLPPSAAARLPPGAAALRCVFASGCFTCVDFDYSFAM
jgi:hypothetical protein